MRIRPAEQIAEEPFRLFFPLAVIATVGGVLLWPLLHLGWISFYPGVAHARVMTVGLAGFLVGFLGTAFPRLTDAPRLRIGEVGVLLALWLASLVFHFQNRFGAGDWFFAALMLVLAACLAGRWVFFGRDTPPPGGPVALLGIVGGGAASAALAWNYGAWMSPGAYGFAKLVLYQATALLPLVGVGPYLLPRLFGHPSPHRFEDSPTPPPGWWPRFAVCAATAFAVLFSFAIEAGGHPRWGMLMRVVAVGGFFGWETPVFRRALALTTPGTAVRWALGAILLAWAGAAADPVRRAGILHLFFVAGLGTVMLGVGARVILGHAGRHDLLARPMIWLRVVIGLALLAATTRLTADYFPAIRLSHLDYAAVTWVAVAVLWLVKLGPFLPRVEGEERPSRCPKARGRTGPSAPGKSP